MRCCPCGRYNPTLKFFFLISKLSQKGTKEKIYLISPGKIKSEKNEDEGPIILALQIRQKAILSL